MDKSFNDQELSDIMKEIESLEQDFKEQDISVEDPKDVMSEPPSSAEEIGEVHPLSSKGAGASAAAGNAGYTSMSFKVSGQMQLELNFDVDGKIVALNVNEEGLTIQMEGGVTFAVPLQSSGSKAA